jgi:hypothetical protein
MSYGLVIKLRLIQDGADVFRVVHEDSGKVLRSGSSEEIKHWIDPKKVEEVAKA